MDDNEAVGDGTDDDQKLRKTSLKELAVEEELLNRKAHECPVPKPKGVVGRVFGFEQPRRSEEPKGCGTDVQYVVKKRIP